MTDHQPGQPQYGPPPEYPPFPPPVIAVEQPPKKKPAVPQWVVGIAAGVIVLCALCGIGGIAVNLLGGGDETPTAKAVESTPTPTVTAKPAVEEPTAEPTDLPDLPDAAMEVVYVQVLRDSPYPEFDEFTDQQLVAMGELVCDEIEAEGFVERMVRLSLDPDVDVDVAGYLTGAAVTALCPEFRDEMEAAGSGG